MNKTKMANGKFKYTESYKGLDGKRHRVSVTKNHQTRATEREAYEELRGKIQQILQQNQDEKPLNYFMDEFIKLKEPTAAKNTLQNYRTTFKIFRDDTLIKNLQKRTVEAKLNALRSEYSVSSIKLFRGCLNTLFNYIHEYHSNTFNMKVKFTLSKEEKVKEREKIKFVETNSIPETLDKIVDLQSKDFAELQLLTGLRAGELLAIDPRRNINFKEKYIDVKRTRQADGTLTAPKTISSIRKVYYPSRAEEIIKRNITSSKYLFDISLSKINYDLRPTGYSTHAFRHTHAALLIEKGVPIKVISERLGHSDTKTTLDIYTHVTEKMKIDLMDKLEKLGTF